MRGGTEGVAYVILLVAAQSHVHDVELAKKITDRSIVINRSCSQPDPRIYKVMYLMQQGSRAGNVGSRMQLIS